MIVDSGNLSNTPDKLAIIAPLMAKMHYDALGIGVYDRRLGEQYLQQVAKNKLTVLDTAPEAPKGVEPFVVKNINGVKVGIVSFGAPPIDADPADDYAMRKARFAAYMQARAKADVLILLDQADVADPDWIQRNGARIGAPDIVIGGASKSGPLVVGKTQIMPTSVEGKTVGVVDIEMADGRDPKLSARSVVLDDKIKADEAVAKQVSDFSIATTHPGTVASAHPGPAPAPAQGTQGTQGTPYYSPALCKACHINEYEDWRKSKHASAIATIVEAKSLTPECLSCHSEMFRRLQRVTVPSDNVGGVECATCHMNSLPHGMERRSAAAKAPVNKALCLSCHTKDRSPNYNERTYFPKVVHASGVKG